MGVYRDTNLKAEHGFLGQNNDVGQEASGELIYLEQIHSNICLGINNKFSIGLEGSSEKPEGDALVTDKAGLVLCILTADCAPVLFYGEKPCGSPVIGAAHAGWGGAFKGVLENTIAEMQKFGAEIETIHATIGPCIQRKSYEVDQVFYDRFMDQDNGNEIFFTSGQKHGYFYFDLSGYCAGKLYVAGVKHVLISGLDTYTDEREYASYRRCTHENEPDYGRQASFIMIST